MSLRDVLAGELGIFARALVLGFVGHGAWVVASSGTFSLEAVVLIAVALTVLTNVAFVAARRWYPGLLTAAESAQERANG